MGHIVASGGPRHMACRALHCTGQHCAECNCDIVGGYPGLVEGTRVCFGCPNRRKGRFAIVVYVDAVDQKRAEQTLAYALAEWYPHSDSNAFVATHTEPVRVLRAPEMPA